MDHVKLFYLKLADLSQDPIPGEAVSKDVEGAIHNKNKRKLLLRLGQKGTWSGPEAPNSSGAAEAPPAERRDLTYTVTAAERGKPVVSPSGKTALARGVDETAGKGGGSKRKPACNEPDRD